MLLMLCSYEHTTSFQPPVLLDSSLYSRVYSSIYGSLDFWKCLHNHSLSVAV